jgi:hypothetical protein
MMVQAAAIIVVAVLTAQAPTRLQTLIDTLRPVLPFPAATPDGDLPADDSADSKWFVVWPGPDDTRIIVRANPLHPEVQKASAEAMQAINAAVAAAERRAQTSYDRAIEQLRKTGKAGDLDTVSLDDEGAAGERIDAELELTISLEEAASFEIASSEAPVVQPGARGASWIVAVPANTYRPAGGDDRRERFRAAETHLFFGLPAQPTVIRTGNGPHFRIEVAPAPNGFAIVLRGNATLGSAVASGADWARLAPR